MIKRVDHVGIAVQQLDDALRLYHVGLGMKVGETRCVDDQGVRVCFVPAGETNIELLEPMGAGSSVGKFLEKRGEGIHHICLEVDDLAAALGELEAQGFQLIDKTPRRGAHGLIAFVHPKSANGVLLELTQSDEH